MSHSPLRALTEVLLKAANRLDLARLTQLVSEDHQRIEIDGSGKSIVLTRPVEWMEFLRRSFAALKSVQDKLDWEILDFTEQVEDSLGIVRLKYRQTGLVAGQLATQLFWVSLVWKQTEEGWKNSLWHASRLEVRPV
ncbi:MAG: nuclear transport factor 2 family protein [Bacteroidota bacterium]